MKIFTPLAIIRTTISKCTVTRGNYKVPSLGPISTSQFCINQHGTDVGYDVILTFLSPQVSQTNGEFLSER